MQEFLIQNWFSVLVVFYIVGYLLTLVSTYPEELVYERDRSVMLMATAFIVVVCLFWPLVLIVRSVNK